MSRSFYVVPAQAPPAGPTIQLTMASMLARRYLDGDDLALHGLELDRHAMPWLEGVRDTAGNNGSLLDDAELLLAELAKHGSIRIEVER